MMLLLMHGGGAKGLLLRHRYFLRGEVIALSLSVYRNKKLCDFAAAGSSPRVVRGFARPVDFSSLQCLPSFQVLYAVLETSQESEDISPAWQHLRKTGLD
jgi:hypothetical protein